MSIRRFPLFALSLFLALLLFPSRAFALDIIPKGVIYQGDVQGTNYGAVVSAYNQYDAACYVLGKDPNTISSSIKAKLSDSNYGGKFYDYAQSFFTQSGGLEDMPEWVPTYIFWGSEVMDLVLADYQAVWYSTTTKALHDAALVDFARILNGEDVGGGGGSGGSGDVSVASSYFMKLVPAYKNSTYWVWAGGSKIVFNSAPSTCVIRFDEGTRSHIASLLSDGYDVVFINQFGNGTVPTMQTITFSVIQHGATLVQSNNLVAFKNNTSSTLKGRFRNSINQSNLLVDGVPTYDYTFRASSSVSPVYGLSAGAELPFGFQGSVSSPRNFVGAYYLVLYSDGTTSADPPPPSGVWPEPEPTPTPTAPDLPEPVDPTVTPDPVVTEPTVTWPSPTITIDPDPVPGTTPTGLDYTELLTRINDNLISIDSFARVINSNLNSLRSDLVNEFNGVVQGLRNIYTYLQHMDSVLERHCVHLQNKMEDVSADLQNKMRELVHWLAEQLDFDSESSGNSDLFGILSTISDKLGGGTYEPNPIRDELGYYEWLDNLWDRFLLGDNWQASVGSISQSFGQLTSRFPFSVPWDIVALFRLFVHDPVTPVFDLPLYYSADDYATVHVDLSGWDGVAAVVRPLVFVIFALNLALLSRHLLAGFGADKGGL